MSAAEKALAGRKRILADVDEVVRRVWAGRTQLRREFLTDRGFEIRVGVDFWNALWALTPYDVDYHAPGVDKRIVPVDGHEPEWGVFLFGIRLRRDEKLDPRGIVFRAEIVL